jgi:hypothetical protein
MKEQLHPFSTSALEESERWASQPGCFNPQASAPDTEQKVGGSRNGLDAKEKKKSTLFQENISILVKSILGVLQATFNKNNVALHFL